MPRAPSHLLVDAKKASMPIPRRALLCSASGISVAPGSAAMAFALEGVISDHEAKLSAKDEAQAAT